MPTPLDPLQNHYEARDPVSAFESPTFGEDSCFHIDQPVGSLSISPFLPHHTPWEVADVQWSPFASRDFWVVSTSNQKALVWNLAMKTTHNSIEHVLHAHSRAITDINFSALHPDVLATCAVDSFVHCWDLRTPSRPALSFSDWVAGATQVKWNKHDPHVIASSHDRKLHIWDDRKGAYPLRTINAHETKIYGVDWNRLRPEAIVTCSLDRTIKFWNYESEIDLPEKVIHTSYPVWRARNTPFGKGCLAMPQRGDSNLHLYSRSVKEDPFQNEEPVHLFTGHKGQVKEFVWRARGGIEDTIDHREFQLVSWDTDKELRLHKIAPEVLAAIDYEKGKTYNPFNNYPRAGAKYRSFQDESKLKDRPEMLHLEAAKGNQTRGSGMNIGATSGFYTRSWNKPLGDSITSAPGMKGRRSTLRADMNPISWMRGVKISGWEVETLGDEITHVGEKFTKVSFESVNVGQRKATVSMHGPWGPERCSIFLKVDIKFPTNYPRSATLCSTSRKQKKRGGCLEPALRYLLGEHSVEESVAQANENVDAIKSPDVSGDESSDEDEDRKFRSHDLSVSSEELLRPINANVMVPVARASGALWTNDGRLICFFPPKKEKPSFFPEIMGLSEISRLGRTDKTFEAFGRLQAGSPGPRRSKNGGTVTAGEASDDNGSEYMSDCSYTASSSGSSASTDALGSDPAQYHSTNTWRAGSFGFRKPMSADNSSRSLNGMTTAFSAIEPKYNTLYIYTFDDLVPSKRSLAERYEIFGNRPDVCAHNMSVAADLGFADLANVWGLIKLMIESQTPIETHMKNGMLEKPTLALIDLDALDNEVDTKSSEAVNSASKKQKLFAKVSQSVKMRWGAHPFGAKFLVPALFEYFERIGDVQMLAMLSCILYEPELVSSDSSRERRISRGNTTVAFKSGVTHGATLSLGYDQLHGVSPFASSAKDAVFVSPQPTPPIAEHTFHDLDPSSVSTGSMTSHVSGARNITINDDNATTYLSESPENLSCPRTNFQPGGLASSLSRSITLGNFNSLSPQDGSTVSKRKASPGTSWNTSNWATTSLFGKPVTPTLDSRIASITVPNAAQQETETPAMARVPKRKLKNVRVMFKNQDKFDNFQQASVPLLNSKQAAHYRVYCKAYADLLFIWGLPIQRKEVLKLFTISSNRSRPTFGKRGSTFSIRSRKPSQQQNIPPPYINDGLNIENRSGRYSENFRSSANPVRTKDVTKNLKTGNSCRNNLRQMPYVPIACVICAEIIRGMYNPCLNCGHVTCLECHKAWFCSEPNGAIHDSVGCPTGCGCYCSQHAVVQVPMSAAYPPHISDLAGTVSRQTERKPRTAEFDKPRPSTSSRGRGTRSEVNAEAWQAPFSALARGISSGLTLRQGGVINRDAGRRSDRHGSSA
ncbi:hypothetical protein KEM54_004122 [Ascosphaera aggregata]|nr:hypothetical protein KEM54_004122 [Ascosphaera aggregata]